MSRENRVDMIERLARYPGTGPVVSLYLPVALAPDERRQNGIRLGNLERTARQQLERCGLSSRQADARLTQLDLQSLEQRIWDQHSPGYAIFTDGELLESINLPGPVDEAVHVGQRFYLKPLLALLDLGFEYNLLTLSLGAVALYRGDAGGLERIELDDSVPTSLAEVAGRETSDAQLQHHPADRGSKEAVFHGQGSGKDDEDAEIDRFLRTLDDALDDYFEAHDLPLLLAGVDELTSRYRRLAERRNFVEESLTGNVEQLEGQELHERAQPLIEAHAKRLQNMELEALREREDGRPVCCDLDEVLIAAIDGRVDTLFIAADTAIWGRYDPAARKLETHEQRRDGDDDLLDRAAVESYLANGKTYVIESDKLPAHSCVIAKLRY